MRHNQRTLAVAGAAIAAALTLAGCGSDGSGGSDGAGSSSSSDGGHGNAGSTSGGGSAAGTMDPATLKTAGTSLGTVLVDGKGRTVYLFTEDRDNTNAMRCDAACLKEWPPVQGKPKAGSGIDDGLIDTTKIGSRTQATYAGHPLYYYADDKAAGDVKGQGIDQIWYALDASGHAVKKASNTSGSDDDGDTGDDHGGGGDGHGAGTTGGYGY